MLGDVSGLLVADVRAEGGGDGHAGLHQLFAPIPVGGDSQDTVVGQSLDGAPQGVDGLENIIKDHGLEGIELQLSRLGGQGHGHIVADDVVGNLTDHLGDHRVDLAGHDGGAVLLGGQIDLAKAGLGAAGEEPQVVADFGQADGTGLEHGGDMYKAVQILGGIEEILGLIAVGAADQIYIFDDVE